MMSTQSKKTLPQASVNKLNPPGHRILGDQEHHEEESRSFSNSLHTKQKYFFGTLNTNTLCKVGKLKQLTNTLNKFRIKVLAIQESRFMDEHHFDTENFRIYKGKPAIQINNGPYLFGTAFAVHHSIKDAVIDFNSTSERISTLSIKSANKAYTLINAHAPTNDYNKKDPITAEEFWETLEETINKIPKHHVKILLGDFNAQLGKEKKYRRTTGIHTAHKKTNANGQKLINICETFNLKIMSTQFQKPKRKLQTWKSPNTALGEFQIDHVAISRTNTKELLNVKTRKGFFESDHHLLQIKIKFQPNKKRFKTNKIIRPDPEYLKLNKDKIIHEIKQANTTNWSELSKTITETMKLAQPPRRRKHRWWNTTCDQAIEERISAWKKFSSNKTQEKWEEFLKTQKQSSKTIRKEKRNYDNSRLKEIQQDFTKNNTRNFYRTFRENITGYQPPSLCFRRHDGSLETNTNKNCNILAQYFHELHNCNPPIEKLQFENTTPNPDSTPPSLTEIREIIKQLKNNRAPGEDGIIAEFWKLEDEHITTQIHRILTDIWNTEEIPTEWKTAIIHPLHKKGDKTEPNNYRGISLLPVTYKILSKALSNRLESQADYQIGEYQAGFRKGRSCIEQIWNLKNILQIRNCKNTIVTFVDFKKAYDSIDRQTLFDTLQEFGIDRKTRVIIQQTLTNTTSKIKFMGEISKPFLINTGVRQGDGLSPLLFNIVLEKVIREWEKEVKGIQIGIKINLREKIKCLAFADDLAIFTENHKDTIHAIEKLQEIAQKTGLQISYEKTKYMERKPSNNKHIKTKYGTIERVPHFKYLGEIIQPSGLDLTANLERIKKLQKAYKLTWNHYNKKSISRNAKLRHYNTVVLPEALYAAETTIIQGKTKTKDIEKQERKILRKIFGAINKDGIWTKHPTQEMYKHTEPIIDQFRKRRVKFYGHIHRMADIRLTKRIFNIICNSKNKSKWIKETENDMQQMNITKQDIENRNKFRTMVTKHKFEPMPKQRDGVKWTEGRKRKHSETMRRVWEERKLKTSIQVQTLSFMGNNRK